MNQCTDTLSSWPVFLTSLLAVKIYRHALTLARASCAFFYLFCFSPYFLFYYQSCFFVVVVVVRDNSQNISCAIEKQ